MGVIVRLLQQTGAVIGIMACVTGGTIGAVKLTEAAKRLWAEKGR